MSLIAKNIKFKYYPKNHDSFDYFKAFANKKTFFCKEIYFLFMDCWNVDKILHKNTCC